MPYAFDPSLRALMGGSVQHSNLVDKVFLMRYPFIERGISSCILRLQDTESHEVYAGKLLLPSETNLRDYPSRQRRHACLKECAINNVRFAPEGVCIGLRPIIMTRDDEIFCGSITSPDALDERFEYIWLMHLLEAGASITDKLQRNTAILEPLAHAVHDVHQRALPMSGQQAWTFASPDRLQQKLLKNLSFFEKCLPILRETISDIAWRELWPAVCTEQLRDISEQICKRPQYVEAFERRVVNGHIRKGHGDIKTKNIWFSDYHRSDIVREFKDCLTFIDAIDFNDSFNIIDTLSEAAMLAVDLQEKISYVEYARFLHSYIGRMPEWHTYDELVFTYYMMEKALVCTYMSTLFDKEYACARGSLWTLRVHLRGFIDQTERAKVFVRT